MQDYGSLVPRPFPSPVFDRLQYAKTEGEGLEKENVTVSSSWTRYYKKDLDILRRAPPPSRLPDVTHVTLPGLPPPSLVTSRNVRQDSGAFLLTTELFERANQIVACPITRAAHWHTSACGMLIGDD